jgi:hypothetical protein
MVNRLSQTVVHDDRLKASRLQSLIYAAACTFLDISRRGIDLQHPSPPPKRVRARLNIRRLFATDERGCGASFTA